MAARKTRSKKPKAAPAPVEVVADSPELDEEKMAEDGFEKTRARDETGHFVKDDPSTPENEAYQWTKPVEVEETPIVEPAPEPTPVPAPVKKPRATKKKEAPAPSPARAPEAKVVVSEPAPVAPEKPKYDELTHSDVPLYGAQRFRAKKAVKKGER